MKKIIGKLIMLSALLIFVMPQLANAEDKMFYTHTVNMDEERVEYEYHTIDYDELIISESGEYKYSITDTGYAVLREALYTFTGSYTIPNEIDGYKVIAFAHNFTWYLSEITELIIPDGIKTAAIFGTEINFRNNSNMKIPKNVERIKIGKDFSAQGFDDLIYTEHNPKLLYIEVDENNPLLVVMDGILYKKRWIASMNEDNSFNYNYYNELILTLYPAKLPYTHYIIPDNVTVLPLFFPDGLNLKSISLPENLTNDELDDILSQIKPYDGHIDVYCNYSNTIDFDDTENITVHWNTRYPGTLATPDVRVESTTITAGEKPKLSWNAVENADYYTIWVWADDKCYDNITATEFSDFEAFNRPDTYAISVYARSYDKFKYPQSEPYNFNLTVEGSFSDNPQQNDTEAPRASIWSDSHSFNNVDKSTYDTITIDGEANDNVAVKKMTVCYEGVEIDSAYGDKISTIVQTSALHLGYNEFYIIAEDTSGNTAYSKTLVMDVWESESSDDKGDYTPQEDEIGVKVGDKYVPFDVPPQIINNRTMIPLRAVSETLGAIVNWNADTRAATIDCNGKVCKVTIGSPIITWEESGAWLNGGETGMIETDSPAVIVDNRTLVPLRAISEIFGYEVGWDGETRTVSIEK